jgi:hypothetical protein
MVHSTKKKKKTMVAPKDAVSAAPGTGYQPGMKNTELQSHVAFFDQDNDGIIWPLDTYVQFSRVPPLHARPSHQLDYCLFLI